MNNKIYEEALSSALKRIEKAEEDIRELKKNPQNFNNKFPVKENFNKPGMATSGQIRYIRILKGDPWPEMTKAEAGKEIDRLLEVKKDHEEQEESGDYEIPKVVEPPEVDTEDAGLDSEDLL